MANCFSTQLSSESDEPKQQIFFHFNLLTSSQFIHTEQGMAGFVFGLDESQPSPEVAVSGAGSLISLLLEDLVRKPAASSWDSCIKPAPI